MESPPVPRVWAADRMYLEAELSLAFDQPTTRVRVATPSWGGRVLHLLTFGRASVPWERESFETPEMVSCLARAMTLANVHDVVSVAADDDVIYLDERRTDGDMEPALMQLRALAAERPRWPARIEVVAEHHDALAHTSSRSSRTACTRSTPRRCGCGSVFFAGNDYEDELRAGLCFPVGDPPLGDAAWELIRSREIGVTHIYRGYEFGEAGVAEFHADGWCGLSNFGGEA